MSMTANPEKLRNGKICESHPGLNGLRWKSSSSCVQCQKDSQEARRRDKGIQAKTKLPDDVAKERIRQRDLARNRKRRLDDDYNAAQLERKKAWRSANSESHKEASRNYDRLQMRTNMQRRLSKNLRHRLRKAVIGEFRAGSAVRDLGMPVGEFRAYIEKKFTEGMSWENYGEWHLDHIKPLKLFDLSEPNQFKLACHYSNIQPLWAKDNLSKWCHYKAGI